MAHGKQLRRSRDQKMIAGVCGGLAEYLGMDVSIVRLLYVLGSIFSAAFPGIIVYVVMAVVIPEADEPRQIPGAA